jgi:hypothetical protein
VSLAVVEAAGAGAGRDAWLRRARDAVSARLPPRAAKFLHWEFWPTWAAYAPLAPAIAWWMVRHGTTAPLLANAHPDLAVYAGESKASIMRHIPPPWGVATELIPAGPREARSAALDRLLARAGWGWPIVLKPDKGCRGQGFRVARSREEAEAALADHPSGTVVQPFHPGPHEIGVFYVREPGCTSGRIFSITRKERPFVVGDGRASLEELIRRDPRRRLQSAVFFARLGRRLGDVPPAGERVSIGQAGNHCQGAVFRDGASIVTPALERRIEEIARGVPGLRFGRFDVRYADPGRLAAGEGFSIIELNGVSSESTNMYDPGMSLAAAYRVFAHAMRLSFEIGGEERRAGRPAPPLVRSLGELRRALREERASPLAD